MILVLFWAGYVCCKSLPHFQRSLCKGFSSIPHSRGCCEQRESGVGDSHWLHQDFSRLLAKPWRQGTSWVYFYICFLPLFPCLPPFCKTIPQFIGVSVPGSPWALTTFSSPVWSLSCSISFHGVLYDPRPLLL